MITITGGKLTTWRRMAKMTVDRLVEREARDAPCRTHEIPLGQAIAAGELPRVEGVPDEAYAALARATDTTPIEVLALAGARSAAHRADRRRACPTCSPRWTTRRAASRRARGRCAPAAHAPWSARGARAGSTGPMAHRPVRPVAGVLARELRWSGADGERDRPFRSRRRAPRESSSSRPATRWRWGGAPERGAWRVKSPARRLRVATACRARRAAMADGDCQCLAGLLQRRRSPSHAG